MKRAFYLMAILLGAIFLSLTGLPNVSWSYHFELVNTRGSVYSDLIQGNCTDSAPFGTGYISTSCSGTIEMASASTSFQVNGSNVTFSAMGEASSVDNGEATGVACAGFTVVLIEDPGDTQAPMISIEWASSSESTFYNTICAGVASELRIDNFPTVEMSVLGGVDASDRLEIGPVPAGTHFIYRGDWSLADTATVGGIAGFCNDDVTNTGANQLTISIGQSPKIYFHAKHSTSGGFLLVESPDDGSEPEPAKICGDGSSNTLVSIVGTGASHEDIILRISDDPDGTEEDLFGSFEHVGTYGDSLVFDYHHPVDPPILNLTRFYPTMLEVVVGEEVVVTHPINLYRTPVVMIHGLWSNSSAFLQLKLNLELYGWPVELAHSYNYEQFNSWPFELNRMRAYYAIDEVLDIARDNKYSAGKVSVVGHSMGGILARLYLQDYLYNDSINRLITINTPHSGSQMANFLLDHPIIADGLAVLGHPNMGAINDLAVDSQAILEDLNDVVNLERNKVPSHVIYTTDLLEGELPGSWVGGLLELIGNSYPQQVLQNIVNSIFNYDSNDFIVANDSQRGGLTAGTSFGGIWHSESLTNFGVLDRVTELLQHDPESDLFSSNGFHPPELSPPSKHIYPLPKRESAVTEDITFVSPAPGAEFFAGQAIQVDIQAGGGVEKIMFAAGSRGNDPYFETHIGQMIVTEYQIPLDVSGNLNLVAFGFGDQGFLGMTTITIGVGVTAELDSVTIDPSNLDVSVAQTSCLQITGHYDDGVDRNLTYSPNIAYSVLDESTASVDEIGVVTAVSEGESSVVAFIGTVSDTVGITVAASPVSAVGDWGQEGEDIISPVFQDGMLKQNFPNPLNPQTTIAFELPRQMDVTLRIFDMAGRLVKELITAEPHTPGRHEAVWNGRDNTGRQVASGTYFYSLEAGSYSETKRMVLVK